MCHVSCVTCHMSYVKCQVSHVTSNFQTVRARQVKFWEKGHLLPPVICHVSCVMCHMSCVTCHVSHVSCHMSRVTCHVSGVTCNYYYLFFLQSGEASRWRICYQWGLPHLVLVQFRYVGCPKTHLVVTIQIVKVNISLIASTFLPSVAVSRLYRVVHEKSSIAKGRWIY